MTRREFSVMAKDKGLTYAMAYMMLEEMLKHEGEAKVKYLNSCLPELTEVVVKLLESAVDSEDVSDEDFGASMVEQIKQSDVLINKIISLVVDDVLADDKGIVDALLNAGLIEKVNDKLVRKLSETTHTA